MGRPKGSVNKGSETAAPVDDSKFIKKSLEGVTIPKDIEEVAITSDGQVFFLPNGMIQARKHQASKKLDLVFHKVN